MKNKATPKEDPSVKEFDDVLWTRHDVARFFGVSLNTVDSWKSKGLLVAYRKNSRVFFLKSEVLSFLREPP